MILLILIRPITIIIPMTPIIPMGPITPGMATIGAPVEEAVTLMAVTIAKVPGEMSQG